MRALSWSAAVCAVVTWKYVVVAGQVGTEQTDEPSRSDIVCWPYTTLVQSVGRT